MEGRSEWLARRTTRKYPATQHVRSSMGKIRKYTNIKPLGGRTINFEGHVWSDIIKSRWHLRIAQKKPLGLVVVVQK